MNELKSNKRLNKNKIKLKHNGGKIKKRNSKKKKNLKGNIIELKKAVVMQENLQHQQKYLVLD